MDWGTIACLLGIGILILAVFKGISPLLTGVFTALWIIIFNNVPVWDSMVTGYLASLTGFIKQMMLILLMGSIFGEFMQKSRFAESISYNIVDLLGPQRGIAAITVITWVLSYSGISALVIMFVVYPIALYICHLADIPRRLIPGMLCLGSCVCTMTMIPGTPTSTNLVATNYLGTDIYAAPVLGMILAVFAGALGLIYLTWQNTRYKANGEHFTPGRGNVVEELTEEARKALPKWYVAFVPVAIIFVGNLIFNRIGLNSTFGVCISMTIAVIYVILCTRRSTSLADIIGSLNKCAEKATLVTMNSAAIVGIAGVIKVVPALDVFKGLIKNIEGPPLLAAVLAVDILCGITASSVGGLQIWCELLGKHFLELGVNAQQLHRLITVAAGTLDSLPHCGGNLSYMIVCDLTYQEAYLPIFVATCVIPLITQFLGVLLASWGVC